MDQAGFSAFLHTDSSAAGYNEVQAAPEEASELWLLLASCGFMTSETIKIDLNKGCAMYVVLRSASMYKLYYI